MPSINQEFWINKFIATIRRDSKVLRELHDLEWKTMVIWECQIEKDTNVTSNRVANWLSQEKNSSYYLFWHWECTRVQKGVNQSISREGQAQNKTL